MDSLKYQSLVRPLAIGIALLAGGIASAAAPAVVDLRGNALPVVNLTAQPSTAHINGATIPMWAYVPTGAASAEWSPGPTIVVNPGPLTINLTNHLPTPTSLVVLGQLGGGLGTPARVASPVHNGISSPVTLSLASVTRAATVVTVRTATPHGFSAGSPVVISGLAGTAATYNGSYTIATIVNATTFTYAHAATGPTNATVAAAASAQGVTAVARDTTTFPANGAGSFTAPTQGARVRSFGTELAANGTAATALTWTSLRPGTYLYETGTHPSIQAPMGLYGVLVVTDGAAGAATGNAYPAVPFDASAVALVSEIDPVQNAAVAATTLVAGVIDESKYPFAVNYAPTYFLLNGQSFDVANPALSALVVAPAATSGAATGNGNVLVRYANAGLRTHVPALVGLEQSLVAEDGNLAPGARKVQAELLLPAGKTADVFVRPTQTTAGTFDTAAYPFFDRALGTSVNNTPNGGLHGYLAVVPTGNTAAAVIGDRSTSPVVAAAAGSVTLTLGDSLASFAGNALATSTGISNAALATSASCVWTSNGLASAAPQTCTDASGQKITLNPSGSFTVLPGPSGHIVATSFGFYGNGTSTLAATVTLNVTGGADTGILPLALTFPNPDPAAAGSAFWEVRVGSVFHAAAPGVLADSASKDVPAALVAGPTAVNPGLPLTAQLVAGTGATAVPGWVTLNSDGSFTAYNCNAYPDGAASAAQAAGSVLTTAANSPGACTFSFVAVDSLGHASAPQTVTVTFPAGSGLPVTVADAPTNGAIAVTDYNWIIEEDTTWFTPPGVTPAVDSSGIPAASLATSFHSSHMPVVAAGCTGPASCGDSMTVNNGTAVAPNARSLPADVVLDPAKRYYISVLPGDSADPTINGNDFVNDPSKPADQTDPAKSTTCLGTAWAAGAGYGGSCGHTMAGASINALSGASYPPVQVLAQRNPIKPAQLSIYIYADNTPTNGQNDESEDGLGGFEITVVDAAGRPGDVAGTITYDAYNMPLSNALLGTPGCPDIYHTGTNRAALISGVVYTCPEFDTRLPVRQRTLLPLAGHALIKNIMPGRFDVIARPGADRAAKGETWYQTETLEGTPAQDAFTKAAEPAYFQEFGSPGFHTTIGFMNPAVVAAQGTRYVRSLTPRNGPAPNLHTVTGKITSLHMSRPVEETMYDSGTYEPLSQTTCLVTLNQGGIYAEIGTTISFAQCDAAGNFTLSNVPAGDYELFIWDEWLDQIKAFRAVTVLDNAVAATAVGNIPVFSWFTRVEQGIYNDANHNGTWDTDEKGLSNLFVTIRYRDGSIGNVLQTDSSGHATFTELFPLFNWYVTEADETRYHLGPPSVTVDAGGQPDTTGAFAGLLASQYKASPDGNLSTTRVDGDGVVTEGLQGFINQTEIINWSRWVEDSRAKGDAQDENGGIAGLVVFASTRGFDDPRLLVQNLWEPAVPNVRVNMYREGKDANGNTTMQLVDWTTTFSWDRYVNEVIGDDGNHYIRDTANRLRDMNTGAVVTGVSYKQQANMQCPGQVPGGANVPAQDPYVSIVLGSDQFRCYDGFHQWNQVQPAVYDGGYIFPTSNYDAFRPSWIKPGSLEPGKYVVEVVLPPGYEVAKEEDKNILIGDAWIAPVAQQFGALGDLYILPDQAVLAENANLNNPNLNNITQSEGFQVGPIAYQQCVGRTHRVPDYLTLFPDAQQVAPYAGADRPLCDRKEVVMQSGGAGGATFYIFTQTPPAAHFTGLILDDAASEVNKYAPDFGEKFAMAYAPVALRDFTGKEIQRVYSDQWGNYNGLVPSTWEVNVPNPSGYSPNMLVLCMNDPGPIAEIDAATGLPTGRKVMDPQYNPGFSNFCYTWPFMPGRTTYLDTPVLPVSAFADGYNPPDCAYPDSTPAIRRADGSGAAFGPYVATSGGTLTLTALGDKEVPNPVYAGPASLDPANPTSHKTVTRHYGFGSQGANSRVTLTSATGTVTTLATGTWNDAKIVATVPALPAGAYQLGIRSGAGVNSVDSITVTVGNAAPVYVTQSATKPANSYDTIQAAINAARPGDLVLVDEGNYNELVVMWKPVQLQGVGAESVVINAAKYPTEKLEQWRPFITQLFGLDPIDPNNQSSRPQIDPLPTQTPITGGVTLLEPTILATEEGAGITVLAKDIGTFNGGSNACSNTQASTHFDVATYSVNGIPLTSTNARPNLNPTTGLPMVMSDSIFGCGRKARIDGLTITGSDTGGGIYVNGYAHGLEIANNRIYGNASPMHGGIRVGSPFEEETAPGPQGYGYDVGVNIHHNAITKNGTVEATPGTAGAGNLISAGAGVSICSGTDNYRVNYNFICGNYSSGDGGGIGHIGVSMNGVIAHNQVLFNQSFQQTQSVNGGGIVIEGEGQNINTPANIPPGEGAPVVNTPFGTGNVTIDSNLIVGNLAEAGHGGGIRLQSVNGQDVSSSPTNRNNWYRVTIKNNIIRNNVAGWGGGGISLADTVNSVIVNNTIVSNDSVGIVGEMLTVAGSQVTGYASPAGISSDPTSAPFLADLPAQPASLRQSMRLSNPVLFNDIIWHNRSFFFQATNGGAANLCSSSSKNSPTCTVLTVADTDPAGTCPQGAAYWDLGVVGDANVANSTYGRFNPANSVLSSTTTYAGSNTAVDPGLPNFCNGAKSNPDAHFEPGGGFPVDFFIQPSMALDEMGNFVNVHFGPLSIYNPLTNVKGGAATAYADDHLPGATGSANGRGAVSVADFTSPTRRIAAPTPDIDGDPRPSGNPRRVDAGADQYSTVQAEPAALVFSASRKTTSPAAQLVLTNSGTATVGLGSLATSAGFVLDAPNTTCGTSLAAGASCTVSVAFTALDSLVGPRTTVINGTLDAGEAGVIGLTGNVVTPTWSLAPSPVAFGNVTRSSTQSQVLTVTNTTPNANLVILGVPSPSTTNGASAGLFSSTSSCAAVASVANNGLAPGASCTITETLTVGAATTLGSKQAVQALSTDTGNGPAVFLTARVR
jgi:hypothetical protein